MSRLFDYDMPIIKMIHSGSVSIFSYRLDGATVPNVFCFFSSFRDYIKHLYVIVLKSLN